MKDIYQEVTNAIIEQLEAGIIPWHKPWTGNAAGAISHNTGRAYSLINQILLMKPGEYLTFNQCKAEGGHVKKGAKARTVVFWKVYPKQRKDESGNVILDENGKPEIDNLPVLKYFQVFHIDDCEGITPKYPDHAKNATAIDPASDAEKIFTSYIQRECITLNRECIGDKASYSPALDIITLPHVSQFDSIEEYYSTAFHEGTHSTGHRSRLNRFNAAAGVAAFGSSEYSKEELVAEIGAACCLARIGINTAGTLKNSAAYIQGWLKALKNDKRMIISAASRAEKAVALIFNDAVNGGTPAPAPGSDKATDTDAATVQTDAATVQTDAATVAPVQTDTPASTAKKAEKKPVSVYSRSQISAFKRFIPSPKKYHYADRYAGMIEFEGKYYILDGFKLLELAQPVDSLQTVQTPETFGRMIAKSVLPAAKSDKKIALPELKALKEAIKQFKAAHGKKDTPLVKFSFDGFDYAMNAEYLANMLQALPDCTGYRPASNVAPLYFSDGTNSGIVLPVRYSGEMTCVCLEVKAA